MRWKRKLPSTEEYLRLAADALKKQKTMLRDAGVVLAIETHLSGRRVIEAAQGILGKANFDKLRSVAGDLLDIDTWKGAWFIGNQMVQLQATTLQRRLDQVEKAFGARSSAPALPPLTGGVKEQPLE